MSKTAEVCLEALVYTFGLPIRLGMICSAHTKLSAYQPKQKLPQPTGKYSISVRNDGLRHTMELEDMIHKETSHSCYRKRVLQWNEVHELGEFVNNNQDGIGSFRKRQPFHEIEGDDFPRSSWYGQGLEKT